MDLASIQQIAVASSAIVATLTFIYKVFDEKRSRDARDLFDRQLAMEHQASREAHVQRESRESLPDTFRAGVSNAAAKTIADGLLASTAPKKISVSIAAERITDRKTSSRFPLLTFKRSNGFVLRGNEGAQTSHETTAGSTEAPLSRDEEMRNAASNETQELLLRIAELRAKSEAQKS
jgi:hypothetical protein